MFLSDDKGAISGFIIHLDPKLNLKIQAFENKEADKRTSTAAFVWLSKNAKEISALLQKNDCKIEGEIEIDTNAFIIIC